MRKITKISILVAVVLVSGLIAAMIPRNGQDPAFHQFADSRHWLGIQNFGNVMSNLPFLAIGAWGFIELQSRGLPKSVWVSFAVLFSGILLTGFGSAYYHWAPNNDRLIFDRMPMTVVFMSALVVSIGQWVDQRASSWLLGPLVGLGIASVLWWYHTELLGVGDLRLYWWVQFFPMVGIPLILILFGRWDNLQGVTALVWVVLWYAVAKGLEALDVQIFHWTGFVSGHTLKHLAAAVSAGYLIVMFKRRYVLESGTTGQRNFSNPDASMLEA